MQVKSESHSHGIGFFGLLTIVFIVLKLCRVIDWSWWWVLAPLWGGFLLWLLLVVIAALIVASSDNKPTYRWRGY